MRTRAVVCSSRKVDELKGGRGSRLLLFFFRVVVVVVGVVGGRRWMLVVGFGWVGWCVSGQWLGTGVGGGLFVGGGW